MKHKIKHFMLIFLILGVMFQIPLIHKELNVQAKGKAEKTEKVTKNKQQDNKDSKDNKSNKDTKKDDESSNTGDNSYPSQDIKYGGKTFTKDELSSLMPLASQYQVLPSFFISQTYNETNWGTASQSGMVDHDWSGIKFPGKHTVSVTKGTPATDDGGNYAHYSSVGDFFKDYFGWIKNNGYKIFGQADFKIAIKGLFKVGGASGDYASAGYDTYFHNMVLIRNAINSQNNNILDKLDKAVVSNGKWNGNIQSSKENVDNTKQALKDPKVDNDFVVNGYGTVHAKNWHETLDINKELVSKQQVQNDLSDTQKDNLQTWKTNHDNRYDVSIIQVLRWAVVGVSILLLVYSVVLLLAYLGDRIGILEIGFVEIVTSKHFRTAFPDENSTLFQKQSNSNEPKIVTLRDILVIDLICLVVFSLIITGSIYQIIYALYGIAEKIVQWGNSLH